MGLTGKSRSLVFYNKTAYHLGHRDGGDFKGYIQDRASYGIGEIEKRVKQTNRATLEDIMKLRVPAINGKFAQIGSVVSLIRTVGPEIITRYNLYPAA